MAVEGEQAVAGRRIANFSALFSDVLNNSMHASPSSSAKSKFLTFNVESKNEKLLDSNISWSFNKSIDLEGLPQIKLKVPFLINKYKNSTTFDLGQQSLSSKFETKNLFNQKNSLSIDFKNLNSKPLTNNSLEMEALYHQSILKTGIKHNFGLKYKAAQNHLSIHSTASNLIMDHTFVEASATFNYPQNFFSNHILIHNFPLQTTAKFSSENMKSFESYKFSLLHHLSENLIVGFSHTPRKSYTKIGLLKRNGPHSMALEFDSNKMFGTAIKYRINSSFSLKAAILSGSENPLNKPTFSFGLNFRI